MMKMIHPPEFISGRENLRCATRGLALILAFAASTATFAGGKMIHKQAFDVQPLTRYRLSFNCEARAGTAAAWSVKSLTKDGLVPYEGVYAYPWQKITSSKKRYIHLFRTPRNAARLEFTVSANRGGAKIANAKLERITDSCIVLNGDFSLGTGNYSGWNTHFLAKLLKDEKGGIMLKCEAIGYALTDLIPVTPGDKYRYAKGSRHGRILAYDIGLLRVDQLPSYTHKKPLIEIPPGIRYIRVEYCDGRTYRPGCPPIIYKLELERVEKGMARNESVPQAYPAEIVIAPNSPPPVARAAREIQHWVRMISGKSMMTLAAPSRKNNLKIFVGRSFAEKLFPDDIKFLKGSDGFAVRREGDAIYVFGAKPAGAVFGAIRLIEKNSDIIFARPRKEFGTVYSKNSDFKFENVDFRERPAFLMRVAQPGRANPYHTSIWHGRVGMNSTPYLYNQFRRTEEGGTHAFGSNYMGVINRNPKFTPEIVKEKYPDLYALVDGKRYLKHKFICPTHPKAVEAITGGFIAVMKEAEKRGIELSRIGIRVQDGWTVCSCDRCMQPIPLPGGGVLKPKSESAEKDQLFFSTRKAVLLNQVAKEFAKVYPNTPIGVEAYIYESEPPAIPYASNLVPMFCAYPTSSLRFPLLDKNNSPLWRRRFKAYLDWSRKNNAKLSMFGYYYVAGFSALADTAGADWKAMVELGGGARSVVLDGFPADNVPFKKFKSKTYGAWEYAAPEKWVMTRLLWDPTKDPRELRRYYIKRAYKGAESEMSQFYGIIEKVWTDPKIKASVNCHVGMGDMFDTFIVKTGNQKKLRSLLVAAQAKATNANSKILISRTLKAFDLMAGTLSIQHIPNIQESTEGWKDPGSIFWEQALKKKDFKLVSTWRNNKKALAENQTKMAMMTDGDKLYIKFDVEKPAARDMVEVVLEASRSAVKNYFSLRSDGRKLTIARSKLAKSENWDGVVTKREDGYTAIFAIPFSSITDLKSNKPVFDIYAKFARFSSDANGKNRVESSLLGFSITRGHYMNYWTRLQITKKGN